MRISRALISVSDKAGLAEFGAFLAAKGVEILSTGGSARALADAGIEVREVGDYTGFPEIMDGRVKTLHPLVHGGILARRGVKADLEAMQRHGIAAIDLVVVNLYPFEQTVAGGGDLETCIENIDIGGPALIRAAAKNHESVTVVTDIRDYAAVMDEMKANGGATTPALRRRLAADAFARTAAYDAAIGAWFAHQTGDEFPRRVTISGQRAQALRYGENPHQAAAFYTTGGARPGVATAAQLQGKELSYNNLNDTDAAFELVAEFAAPAVAIIKHANPCGVALGETLAQAYASALRCDPVSAFGGIIAVNRSLDADAAKAMAELFLEVIIAPKIDAGAREVLAAKKNLRVLETGAMPDAAAAGRTARLLSGGFLLQGRDAVAVGEEDLKTVTERTPSAQEVKDEARQIERHRLRQRRRHRRHRRRPDEPGRCIAHRGAEGGGGGPGGGSPGVPRRRLGGRVGRLLPVRRRALGGGRGGRDGGHPARRLGARRRGHRRRRRGRPGDGFHWHAALPALIRRRDNHDQSA